MRSRRPQVQVPPGTPSKSTLLMTPGGVIFETRCSPVLTVSANNGMILSKSPTRGGFQSWKTTSTSPGLMVQEKGVAHAHRYLKEDWRYLRQRSRRTVPHRRRPKHVCLPGNATGAEGWRNRRGAHLHVEDRCKRTDVLPQAADRRHRRCASHRSIRLHRTLHRLVREGLLQPQDPPGVVRQELIVADRLSSKASKRSNPCSARIAIQRSVARS